MPGPEGPPIPDKERQDLTGVDNEEEADAALDALEDEFERDMLEYMKKSASGEASPEERQSLKNQMKKKFVDGIREQIQAEASEESEATEVIKAAEITEEKGESTEGGEAEAAVTRKDQKRMVKEYGRHSDSFMEKFNELDNARDIDTFESALMDLRLNNELITEHRFDGETGEELDPGWEVKLQLAQARDRGILSEEEYTSDLQDIQDDIDRQLREGKIKDKIEQTEQLEKNEVLSSEQLEALVEKFDKRVAKAWGDVLFERNNALQEIIRGKDSRGEFEHRTNIFSDGEYIYEAFAETYSDDRQDEWRVIRTKREDLINPPREKILAVHIYESGTSATVQSDTQRLSGSESRKIIEAYDASMQDSSITMEQGIKDTAEKFNRSWEQSQ
ncbi:hypothetical protein ACFL1U_01025 [Patescibacteria group bacterium]